MKVAIFIPTLNGGGAEKVAVNLANGLYKLGIEVFLLVGDGEGQMRSILCEGVEIINFKVKRLLHSFFQYRKFLGEKNVDYVVSFLNHTNIFSILTKYSLFKSDTKFISTIHSITSFSMKKKLKKNIFSFLAIKKADGVICVSKAIKRDLQEKFNTFGRHLEIIYNPVFTEEEARVPFEKGAFISRNKYSLISVGRLETVKDFPTLIRAVAYLRDSYQVNFKLDIYGEGRERENLQKLIGNLGLQDQITLKGYEQNILEKYSEYHLFVLPSLKEGFGNVIIEAIASQRRVICSKGSGAPEELLGKGDFGSLYASQNYESLAKTILTDIDKSIDHEKNIGFAKLFIDIEIAKKYLEFMRAL